MISLGCLQTAKLHTAVLCGAARGRRCCQIIRTRSSKWSLQYEKQYSTRNPQKKKSIIFFGTPEVATVVFDGLLQASKSPHSNFAVKGVVSQPARSRGRNAAGKPATASPVSRFALEQAGFPESSIFTPQRAGEPDFLDAMSQLNPDLFVTAAYGNYLPSKLLGIPRHGTLNIHPSLLPKYRGAAPVQRALMDGVTTTGVSVLYSVREMDAGPVLAQRAYKIPPDTQAPQLMQTLFELGTDLLVDSLPSIWAGEGPQRAWKQDASAATPAPKLSQADAPLDFEHQSALVTHNQVRACAGWPGSTARISIQESERQIEQTIKVLETRVGSDSMASDCALNSFAEGHVVDTSSRDSLRLQCGDGSVLFITKLQVPGKKAMAASDFINGLRGRTITWIPNDEADGAALK